MDRISRESIEQASLWMARLWADDVTEQDKKAFNTWRTAHPDNEFAWQQLENLQKSLPLFQILSSVERYSVAIVVEPLVGKFSFGEVSLLVR